MKALCARALCHVLLGRGESEAIILAQELKVDLLLVDDADARDEASSRNLVITGTAGVLVTGQLKNAISRLKPELEGLRTSGFFLSDRLYNSLLSSGGE